MSCINNIFLESDFVIALTMPQFFQHHPADELSRNILKHPVVYSIFRRTLPEPSTFLNHWASILGPSCSNTSNMNAFWGFHMSVPDRTKLYNLLDWLQWLVDNFVWQHFCFLTPWIHVQAMSMLTNYLDSVSMLVESTGQLWHAEIAKSSNFQ